MSGRLQGRRVAASVVVAMMAIVAATTGCGGGPARPKTYPTSGTITYKGKPLADATVSFVPSSGPPSDGRTDASGKYTIMTSGNPGAPVGKNRVTVSKVSGPATMPSAPSPDDMKAMYEKKKKGETDKPEVPAKYGRPDTSGLTAEVTADAAKNVFDFELTD